MMRYIMDQDGKMICLTKTTGSVAGVCPYCGAHMHGATSKLGNRYAALNRGETHTNAYCAKLETLKRTPDFDRTKSLEPLIDRLSADEREASRKTNPPKDTPQGMPRKENQDELAAITSVHGLLEAGFRNSNFDDCLRGGRLLAEDAIRPSWLLPMANAGIPFDGKKFVECFCFGVNEEKQNIYCSLRWSFGNDGTRQLNLILHTSEPVFADFSSRFCEFRTDEDGRTKLMVKKHLHLLVSGCFSRVRCDPSKCYYAKKGCDGCLGLLWLNVQNRKQLNEMPEAGR